jgi:hypothetical protein
MMHASIVLRSADQKSHAHEVKFVVKTATLKNYFLQGCQTFTNDGKRVGEMSMETVALTCSGTGEKGHASFCQIDDS